MCKYACLCLVILTCGCAQTRISENGQVIASIQGDATNVTVKGRYTYFHADTLNHSNPTLAAGVAIAKVAGIVGSMVAAIFGGVGVIPSAVAVPAAAIPAAASVIPISKP